MKIIDTTLLAPDEQEDIKAPEYTDEEKTYISNLQKKLEDARDIRDQTHPEFDGLDFTGYWHANERGANTMLQIKKNKGDTIFQSGTLRTKLLAFLASFQSLNLKGDITAFNDKDIPVSNLGEAIEDIIDKTEEVEIDKEKKMLRQYEMLKHGYVFLEERWVEKWSVIKKLKSVFTGKKQGVDWITTDKKEQGMPQRRIVSGLSVYLGSLKKYFISEQPHIFSVEVTDYEAAKQIYGKWEMWEYVSKSKRAFSGTKGEEMVSNAWRLTDTKKGQAEIIIYQDKPGNEYQVILNGILMLPMGFPLTEINKSGEYTLIQQNLEPIRHDFAYGKSFVFKNKNVIAILDEMMKLAILKTQKSFLPPRLNLSQRVVTSKMFMPAQITRGINKGEVPPVDDKEAEGVTNAEFAMIQEVIKFVDRNTVSQTTTGAREEGGKVTATQIIELQRQAKIMMGLFTLAAALLEQKLTTARMLIILDKWFEPVGKTIDQAKELLKNKYRITTRSRNIDGEGQGLKIIMPTEEIASPLSIKATEETLKSELGVPVRVTQINPLELKTALLVWVVNVIPKEVQSSEMSKMLFSTMIADGINLGLRFDIDYIEERFAQVWELDPSKAFTKEAPQLQGEAPTPMQTKPKTQ